MIITHEELVKYMLSHDFVSVDSLVEGDLVLKDTSRRNQNFQVITKKASSYFLKQGIDRERIITISREATIYQFFQHLAKGREKFQHFLPQFYKYDSKEHLLIIEFILHGENLKEHCTNIGRFPITHARYMGRLLGTLHHLTKLDNETNSYSILKFEPQPPKFLSFIRNPNLDLFHNLSSANLQLLRIIQQNLELSQFLEDLVDRYQRECLIHSDIKLENFIVISHRTFSSNKRKDANLKLVDWELAHIGDPAWDVGSLFSSYLSLWLFSIPITDETPPDQFMGIAGYPLEKLQPAILSFWHSYACYMKLDSVTAGPWLLKAVRYAAARLIQTAFEFSQTRAKLTGHAICLLQIGLNILRHPQEAIVGLLGVTTT